MIRPRIVFFVVLSGVLAGACATGPRLAPKISSSETSTFYALEAPERLRALTEHLNAGRLQATEAIGTFEAAPGEHEDQPQGLVKAIFEEADEAGRRSDVVEQIRQHQRIAAFIQLHGKEMSWQLNGSVATAARKSACECGSDLGNGLHYALKKATSHELTQAQRSRNQAHALITSRGSELGRKNIQALRDQVDLVTFTSFFVHVDSVDTMLAIDRLLDEASDLRDTLEESIEADQEILDDEEASRAAQKDAQERIDAARTSLQTLDDALEPAKRASKGAVEDTRALQEAYEEAFEKMVDKFKE